MLNTWKNVITLVVVIITAIALHASFVLPASFDIIRYDYSKSDVTYEVTKQARNIYGMKVGEEHTYTELRPEWAALWHSYCEDQGRCD